MKKRMTAVLVLCMLLFCMHGVVFAAQSLPETAQPDLSRECSINVFLTTITGGPVTDGSIQLVQVASLCEGPDGQYYNMNTGFGDLPFDPVETRGKPETAKALEAIAVEKALPYTLAPISTDSTAVYTNLVPGLYLLMQTPEVLESFTAIPACLMLLPDPQEDGSLLYDADCYPKPVTTKPQDESTTVPADETTTVPSDETTTVPSDETTTVPSDETTTVPSDETTTAPSEESTTVPHTPPPGIPKTGQLWWPVAVLGCAGAGLIAVGMAARRKEKE